ncbi:MAG: O-methyltransferase [Bacilli bacterium]
MNTSEMKEYAKNENIPIIETDSLNYILNLIRLGEYKDILEIGTAIGYSSINFALLNENIKVVTIERNENRYKEAINNIKHNNLSDRINVVFNDALNIEIDNKYDLIFIDAAKGQNIEFFNKYKNNLNKNGIIIIDNIKFHGLVGKSEEIPSKNLRALVRKIEESIKYFKTLTDYKIELINVGDGLLIFRNNL